MAYNFQQQPPPYGYGAFEGQSGYPSGPPPPPYGQGQPQYPTNAPPPGFYVPPSYPYAAAHEEQSFNDRSGSPLEGFDFSDQTIRKGFIRKVYSILMLQLLVTMGFIALFLYNDKLRNWTVSNPGFFFAAMAISFITLIALTCCENLRKKSPQNFIFLAIFTVTEGFLLGTAASTFQANAVLLAVGITTVVCLALTIFSFQTKWDFTAIGGILCVCVTVFFIFSLITIFLRAYFPILTLIKAAVGALLFSVYLVYDTQLMMGGKHKYSISPEEYITAALNLYLDIINIFVSILEMVGYSND